MRTVGVLGGGQLARMLALAGHPLGIRTVVLSPDGGCSASDVADVIEAPYDDPAGLDALARAADVVTFEFESVDVTSARVFDGRLPVRPGPDAFRVASDRIVEKQTFREVGMDTAPFVAVDGAESLRAAVAAIGVPCLLKTRRFGYDGKGQWRFETTDDVEAYLERAEVDEVPLDDLILEGMLDFVRELSIVAVRDLDGAFDAWPLTQSEHRGGILRLCRAPAPDVESQTSEARTIAQRLAEHLDYVGVFALELFDMGDGLRANEMAPRVHNSGHWTIEGAVTSQFENHMRAIAGLPLGSCEARGPSAMVNALGSMPDLHTVLAIPGAHVHDYRKGDAPLRKVGHVTVTAPDVATLRDRVDALPVMQSDGVRIPLP
jgi:5-(carboxyamino)imidazole ribonucleotide synthase